MKNKYFIIISILICLKAESIHCTEQSVNTDKKTKEIIIFDELKKETMLQEKEQERRENEINTQLQLKYRNIEKSIEQKATKKCKAKDATECYSLGSYFQSQGRLGQASLFYLKGCDLKNNWSCDAAGKLEIKKGNLEKGRMLINKACDNGYDEACSYLVQIKNLK